MFLFNNFQPSLEQMAYNVPAVYENRNFAGLSHFGFSLPRAISLLHKELALLVRGCF
jgi:hypothetical protein